jgi:hypothetical protein
MKAVDQTPTALGGTAGTWPAVVMETLKGAVATGLMGADAEIVSVYHRRIEHGYPTPSLGRDAVLKEARARVYSERETACRERRAVVVTRDTGQHPAWACWQRSLEVNVAGPGAGRSFRADVLGEGLVRGRRCRGCASARCGAGGASAATSTRWPTRTTAPCWAWRRWTTFCLARSKPRSTTPTSSTPPRTKNCCTRAPSSAPRSGPPSRFYGVINVTRVWDCLGRVSHPPLGCA